MKQSVSKCIALNYSLPYITVQSSKSRFKNKIDKYKVLVFLQIDDI
jgi:hypothetical protein